MYKNFVAVVIFLMPVFIFPENLLAASNSQPRTQETKYIDQYMEIDQNSTTTYILLPNGDKLAEISADGDIRYVLADHLSSSVLLLNVDGSMLREQDYMPYGRVAYSNGRVDSPYYFGGKEQDTESNLQYFGARYYNNTTARFISVDPVLSLLHFDLADPQSLNSYSYVGNNPLRYIDPSGLSRQDYIAPTVAPRQAGDPGGTYKGVQLYVGNGSASPQQSQCVAGVQNLYSKLFGVNIRYGLGAARNYANISEISKGAISYFPQGSDTMPAENDIITWNGGQYGHIGMIIETEYDPQTGTGTVYTLEQNRSLSQEVFSYQLTGQKDGEGTTRYYIEGFGRSNQYQVESWQRPTANLEQPQRIDAPAEQNRTKWYQTLWGKIKSIFSK